MRGLCPSPKNKVLSNKSIEHQKRESYSEEKTKTYGLRSFLCQFFSCSLFVTNIEY